MQAITSPADGSQKVHSLKLNEDEMNRRSAEKRTDSYTDWMRTRNRGVSPAGDELAPYLTLIDRESNMGPRAGFTAMILSHEKEDKISALRNTTEWLRQLANIYHYRLHPEDAFAGPGNKEYLKPHDRLNIRYCLYDKGTSIDGMKSLADVETHQVRLRATAKPERFCFKLEFEGKKKHNNDLAVVRGSIRYHPFEHDRETKPSRRELVSKHAAKESDEQQFGGDTLDDNIFDCFWNGRWIPNVAFATLPFCSDRQPLTDKPLPKVQVATKGEEPNVYRRISGSLYLSVPFTVTNNKMQLTDHLERLYVDSGVRFYLQSPENGKFRLVQHPNKVFNKWLEDQHYRYDREVEFSEPVKTITLNDVRTKEYYGKGLEYTIFNKLKMTLIDDAPAEEYAVGNVFIQQRTEGALAEVTGFLLEGDHRGVPSVCAPSGTQTRYQYRVAPTDIYGKTIEEQLIHLKRALVAKDKRAWHRLTKAEFQAECNKEYEKLPGMLKIRCPKAGQWENNSGESAVIPGTSKNHITMNDQVGPFVAYLCTKHGKPVESKFAAAYLIIMEYREDMSTEERSGDSVEPEPAWVTLDRVDGGKVKAYNLEDVGEGDVYGTWFNPFKEAKGGAKYSLVFSVVKKDAFFKEWTKKEKKSGRYAKFPVELLPSAYVDGCQKIVEWEVLAGPPQSLLLTSIEQRVSADSDEYRKLDLSDGVYNVSFGDELKITLSVRDSVNEPVRIGKKYQVNLSKAKVPRALDQPFKIKAKVQAVVKVRGQLLVNANVEPKRQLWNDSTIPNWTGEQNFNVSWYFTQQGDKDVKWLNFVCPLRVTGGKPHKIVLVDDVPEPRTWISGESLPWPHVQVMDKFDCRTADAKGPYSFLLEYKKAPTSKWVPMAVDGGKDARFVTNWDGVPQDLNPPVLSFPKKMTFDMRVVLNEKKGNSRFADVIPVEFQVTTIPGVRPDSAVIVAEDGLPLNGREFKAGETVAGLRLKILDAEGGELPPRKTCVALKSATMSWYPTVLQFPKSEETLDLTLEDWVAPKIQGPTSIKAKIQFRKNQQPIFAEADLTVTADEPAELSVALDKESLKVGKSVHIWIQLEDTFGNDCDLSSLWGDSIEEPVIHGNNLDVSSAGWKLIDGSRRLMGAATVTGEVRSAVNVTVTWHGLRGTATEIVRSGPPKSATLEGARDSSASGTVVVNGGKIRGGALRLEILDEHGHVCTEVDGWHMTIASQYLKFAASVENGALKNRLDAVVENGTADFSEVTIHCAPAAEDDTHSLVAGLYQKRGSKPVTLSLDYSIVVKSDPTAPKEMILCRLDAPLPDRSPGKEGTLADFPLVSSPIFIPAGGKLPKMRICVLNKRRLPIEVAQLVIDKLSVTLQQKRLIHAMDVVELEDGVSFAIGGPDSEALSTSFKPGAVSIVARYAGVSEGQRQGGSKPSIEGFVSGCINSINIAAGLAESVVAQAEDSNDVVTNSDQESRTIMKSLVLTVVDRLRNKIDDWEDGGVDVRVISPDNADERAPRLDPIPPECLHVKRGVVSIPYGLRLQDGTPGISNSMYKLLIRVKGKDPRADAPQVFEYSWDFRFVDDVKLVLELQRITREIDANEKDTQRVQAEWKVLCDTENEAKRNLNFRKQKQDATAALIERQLREVQSKFDEGSPPSLQSETGVRDTAAYLRRCQSAMARSERRLMTPHRAEEPANKRGPVVGYIANLVTVENDLYCRILTWHLGANLRCLLVRDNKTAEFYKSQDRVLSIMSAKYSDRQWPAKEPQMATKYGGKYLLNQVVFKPECKAEAVIAMNATVGDVLVFPTVKNALDYRAELRSKRKGCGVLYTEDGDKIAGSGITGGREKDSRLPHFRDFPITFAMGDSVAFVDRLLAELEGLAELNRTFDDFRERFERATQQQQAAKPKLQSDLDGLRQAKARLLAKKNELGTRKHNRTDDAHPQNDRRVRSRQTAPTAAPVPDAAAAARVAQVNGWSQSRPSKRARSK